MNINWIDIVKIFYTEYEKIYGGIDKIYNKKIYFDCFEGNGRVVDGARLKWCPVLMLDAILYFKLCVHTIKAPITSKRVFDQHKNLVSSTLLAYQNTLNSIESEYNIQSSPVVVNIQFSTNDQWKSFNSFQNGQLNNAPSKAREKFYKAITNLCNLNDQYSHIYQYKSLSDIINEVVNSIIRNYYEQSIDVYNSKRIKLLHDLSNQINDNDDINSTSDNNNDDNDNNIKSNDITNKQEEIDIDEIVLFMISTKPIN